MQGSLLEAQVGQWDIYHNIPSRTFTVTNGEVAVRFNTLKSALRYACAVASN